MSLSERSSRGRLWRTLLACLLLGPIAQSPAGAPEAPPAGDAALRDYLSANGMLNRGLYELAAAEYRNFLSEHSGHEKAPVARYGLAVCLFRLKEYDAAIVELDRLPKGPEFEFAAEAGATLGQCHLAAKHYGPAVEAFRDVLKKHPDHDLADDAAAGVAEGLYLDGKYDDVIAQAKSWAARRSESPLRPRVELFIGLAFMAKQAFTAAGERFDFILKADSKGPLVEQASQLLAQCRGQDDFARGRTLFEEGKFEQAQPLFEKVAEQKGDLADDAAYWEAKCVLRRGDFFQAARRFAEAAERFPESGLIAEMTYDRAVALLKGNRQQATGNSSGGGADDALGALEQFRSRFPDHPLAVEALYLTAATEHHAQRYPASQTRCREFLEKYPAHEKAAKVAFLSAENDFLEGKYEAALAAYRGFLDAHRDDEQSAAATFRMGMACYHLERFDEALPLLRNSTTSRMSDELRRPALLALGDVLFQRSEWKDAEAALTQYVALGDDAPSADDALLKLGLARHRQEKYQEAIQCYDHLIARFAKSPHRSQSYFERGQALVALNKPEEAAQSFEKVLAEGADSRFAPHALNHLGTIALRRNDPSKAAVFFGRLAQAQPDRDDAGQALLKRGEALMAAGDFASAEEGFAQLLKDHPSHPAAPRARAQRAIALSRQGRRPEALEAIEAIERESFAKLDPTLRQAVLYEKAWCVRESGNTEKAAETYRALLGESDALATDLAMRAALELAEIEAAGKRHDAANALLRRVRDGLSSDVSNSRADLREQAAYRLAVSEFERDKPADAAKLFEEFVEAFPKSGLLASARLFAGEAFFKLGRHDRAATHLTRVVEDSKDDPAYGPALLRLGECLAAQQKWARSEQVFSAYIDRFADSEHSFQARFGVGWARENQSRWDEAVSAYREVTARHQGPTAARAQFQIGECLFAKKQYDEAARALLKVDILYAYPEWSAAALFEAGRCFEKMSKTGEAREQFRAVQEKYAETVWAKKAAEQLAAIPTASLPGR